MNSQNIAGISITTIFLILFHLSFYLRNGYIEKDNVIISVMMIICILSTILVGKKIEN